MQSWRAAGDQEAFPEWGMLASASRGLKETSANLTLAENKEWLRFVLGEIADEMVGTIRWANAFSGRNAGAAGESASYIVPADAARSDVVFAIYCLDFMLAEGLIETSRGSRLRDSLTDLQRALETRLKSLREGWPGRSAFSNN